jgi:uncharacterized protein (UPF0548 family)
MTSTPWRLGRGWSRRALQGYLAEMSRRPLNYAAFAEQMTPDHGWIIDGVSDTIATEPAGPPQDEGPFARARQGLINYDFSDPRVVEAYFDAAAPLLGRTMLLEMKVLGVLRFLGGVRVDAVRDEQDEDRTRFGFRYDTLVGHFERGMEWFLLEKQHSSGVIHCTIQAHWQPGDFPTWWSRLGFLLIGRYIREFWRRQAITRLRHLTSQALSVSSPARGPVHRGSASPGLHPAPAGPMDQSNKPSDPDALQVDDQSTIKPHGDIAPRSGVNPAASGPGNNGQALTDTANPAETPKSSGGQSGGSSEERAR